MATESGKKIVKISIVVISALVFLVLISGAVFLRQKNSAYMVETINNAAEISGALPLETGSENKPISFIFFGDLMLDRNVGTQIKKKGFDFLFEKIKDSELLKNKDIVSSNLEGAVTNGGQHYPPNNSYDFAFLPEEVALLKNYGFNFFNLANNHFIDQGQRGVDETRMNLGALGLDYSGCPDGQIGDCSIKIIQIKNKKIGFAGFSAVYTKLNIDALKKTITELKAQSDFVAVNFHWGNEYQHKFSVAQQEYAHALIDGGADIIIGHHPHVVQGIEIYKTKTIFYSLGNFIFDQYFSVDTQQGLAFSLLLDDEQLTLDLMPFQSRQSQPEFMSGKEKDDFLQKIADWSAIDDVYSSQIQSGSLYLSRQSNN